MKVPSVLPPCCLDLKIKTGFRWMSLFFLRENSKPCELTSTCVHHWADKTGICVAHCGILVWSSPQGEVPCPHRTAHLGNSEFSSCFLARVRNKSWPLSQEGIVPFPLSLLLSPGTAPRCPGVWAQEHGVFHRESVWNLLCKTKFPWFN